MKEINDLIRLGPFKKAVISTIYLAVSIILASIITYIAFDRQQQLANKTEELGLKIKTLDSLERTILIQKDSLLLVKQQLNDARLASEFLQLAIDSVVRKNFSGAIASYDKAIALDPMNPVLYNLKGYAHFKKGEYNSAVESLEKSVQIDPDYIWGHYNLSLVYFTIGKTDEAISEVKKVLEISFYYKDVIARDVQFKPFVTIERFAELLK